MKKIFIIILLTILPFRSVAQSFYVFCPDFEIKNMVKVKGSAYFVIKDGRVLSKKHKEKRQDCNSQEILEALANSISETFPYMKIVFLDESQFNDDPKEGELTIKIELIRFDAYVKSYTWNANTDIKVNIFDNRNNDEPIEVNCKGSGKFAAIVSKGQGRTASRNSFERAFVKVIALIENEMIDKKIEGKNSFATKSDRLRELKQLLDEGILTQEEFDVEKKKILNEH